MEFLVLGPVTAVRDGERVALSGSKIHTVLATMPLAQDRVVSDARLSSLLWGWDPPATASAQIYTYMSRLREQLGDEAEIVRRPRAYVLRAPGTLVDLVEFWRLERDGRRALAERRFQEASELLRRALRLWRGGARERHRAPARRRAGVAGGGTHGPAGSRTGGRVEADRAAGRRTGRAGQGHRGAAGEASRRAAGIPARDQAGAVRRGVNLSEIPNRG
ncbi:AfsR/SARP family transcriptional regulator [Streptomyces massasporeus]|uniref:AfsR/SARP family transcriptional regulator n=1 Tax=Streptomyces massasporeus TaxID=67324 RepID=UPI0037FBA651